MNKIYIFLFLLILLLGGVLRYSNFSKIPRHGATFDEFAWTWLGINIIKEHVPISWSPHPQYKERKEIKYQGAGFLIVKPYLEHPPLFGIVAGSFALLNGAKSMYDVTLLNMRPLALILGFFSIFMVFLLANNLYGTKIALVSSILYATIPTIVIGSRIVQNENFFIPFWLLTIFLISKYLKSKKSIYRNLSAVICGLLILAKIPWIAAALTIIFIFVFLKRYKDALFFLTIVIPIGLLYFLYGYYYDWNLFINLWGLQLNRYDISFTSIYALFQKPYLVDRFFTDGWIYWGWFSFMLLLTKDFKKNILIILPLLSYFLIFIMGIPDEPGHGWYRYPFYPFLVISTALFMKEYFNKNNMLTFFFLTFVGITLFQNTWVQVFGFSYFVFRFIIVIWSLSAILISLPTKRFIKLTNIANYLWLALFVCLNIWSVMLYNDQ